ncbi:MAG: hypothetical protein GXP26_12475 [Planctomycetes bacterium]|nr:hypothetical protein [Planctomycetota bacterium]
MLTFHQGNDKAFGKTTFLELLLCRLVACYFLLVGCGSSGNNGGSISGRVAYQGTPLNSGRVYFTINRGEATRSARIEPDGTYLLKDISAGKTQIAVIVPPAYQATSNDPTAPSFGANLPTMVDPVTIPKRYSSIATSGLTLTVTDGSASHHMNLD